MQTIKLGELLVRANLLQESQLRAALVEQQKWGGRLGDILVRMSLLTEDLLVRALSKQMSVPAVNLELLAEIPEYLKTKIPAKVARELEVVPVQLKEDGRTLVVAMAEPQNLESADSIRARTGCRIAVQLAGRTAIARAITRFYARGADLSDFDEAPKETDRLAQNHRALQPLPVPPVLARAEPASGGAQPTAGIAASRSGADHAAEILRAVEDIQRKEVAALKAMVDLLLEKGVFSREEYLAKVKR
jgi:Type II secretion system (T2SS), protein E, N-terminal domain